MGRTSRPCGHSGCPVIAVPRRFIEGVVHKPCKPQAVLRTLRCPVHIQAGTSFFFPEHGWAGLLASIFFIRPPQNGTIFNSDVTTRYWWFRVLHFSVKTMQSLPRFMHIFLSHDVIAWKLTFEAVLSHDTPFTPVIVNPKTFLLAKTCRYNVQPNIMCKIGFLRKYF